MNFNEFLMKSINRIANVLSINEYTMITWEEIYEVLVNFWNLQILIIDSNPLTVKKIIFSLVLLIIGLLFSKIATKMISSKIYSKFKMDLSAQHAVESFTYYIFIVFFVFFALKVANIPLTIFNLIGGALAIGIGFGSQNIVNNFISGLIIMMERPIKIGDFIQIDDAFGRIENIGMRSTKIISTGNRHIIVPNSLLLENRVDNWTFNGSVIRTMVKVGVTYGSPVSRVYDIFEDCVKLTKNVLINKEILILFENFGDNALEFEVHFFIKIKEHLDEKRAQSDLRRLIEKKLNENDIIVAFPQRDVHLHTSSPLNIKLIDQ